MGWYSGRVREPLLDGASVKLAGQEFVVAPFNIRRMRATAKAREVLRRVAQGAIDPDSGEAIAAITEIAAAALSANYPDISAAVLDDHEGLRPADLTAIIEAVRKVNGGEENGPGEASAPPRGAWNEPKTGIE